MIPSLQSEVETGIPDGPSFTLLYSVSFLINLLVQLLNFFRILSPSFRLPAKQK
jgi:hypothetical protein